MKKIALILVMLLPILVNSQATYLKVKLGPSIPLGNYGVVNYESSSFAKLGGNFEFSAEHYFNDYLGIKGSLSYTFNPFDAEQTAIYFNNAYKGMTHIVQNGSYKIYSFMGGGVVSIPTKTFLSFDFFGLVGYSIFEDPGKKIEGSPKASFDYHRFESYGASTGSISFQAGTDINFRINDRLAMGLGLSYFGTQAKFRDVGLVVEEYLVTTIGTSVSTTDWDYTVHILNVDAGFKILIGKVN